MTHFALPDLPATFEKTRDHLHQVAFFAVSPVRHRAVGKMGLKRHPGGFAAPEFEGKTVRVEGDLLVLHDGDSAKTQRISTVREAIEFLGHEYEAEWFSDFHDPLTPIDPDRELEIDPLAAHAIGTWFAFAWVVLEEVRAHGTPDDNVSEVQLWPEHFDAATELGDQSLDQRASYGASPGDDAHAQPYMYVAAWHEIDRSNPYWNDDSFNGASISYEQIKDSADPVKTAVDFLLEGYRILHAG